jgi:hypothetical protein
MTETETKLTLSCRIPLTGDGPADAAFIRRAIALGWELVDLDGRNARLERPADKDELFPADALEERERKPRGRRKKTQAAGEAPDQAEAADDMVTVTRNGKTYKRRRRKDSARPKAYQKLERGLCPLCNEPTKKVETCSACGRRGCKERCNNTGRKCPDCKARPE